MIVAILALLSLSAIYFIRLLFCRKMKTAAVSLAILYTYLVAWIYAVFIIDTLNLNFSEAHTKLSLLLGSNIYRSFVDLTEKMSVVPLPILKAIVFVCVIAFAAAFAVALHGIVNIAIKIVRIAKKKIAIFSHSVKLKIKANYEPVIDFSFLQMHCRLNC